MTEIDAILKVASPQERAELKILNNAAVENAKGYSGDPSSKQFQAWQTAKSALAGFVADMTAKYGLGPKESIMATPESFPELKDIEAYLTRIGWKTSRSTLFHHQKEGKLSRDKKTGRFLLAKVEKYANSHLKRKDTGTNPNDDTVRYNERKLKSEMRLKEAQATRAELDLQVAQGKYIDREEMERELVGRALVLDSSLRHLLKTFAPEWIDLVGGDQQKRGEFQDAMMETLDQTMNSFASTHDFVVELQVDQEVAQ